MGMPEDTPIEHNLISKALERAQKKVELYHFGIRKQFLQYDDVMNKQREVIYTERREVLEGADIKELVKSFLAETIEAYVTSATATGFAEDWDLNTLWVALKGLFPISFSIDQ